MTGRLSTEEIKLRGTLLGSNKELLQLHRTLVRGGLITEHEFWETRQVPKAVLGLLDSQQTLLRQKRPLSATLGDDIRASGGYHGDQKIILTPETIQSILAQNPAAKRAHYDNVPSNMTEKEFWTCFVQSRFFRHSSDEASQHNPLDRYYEEVTEHNSIDSNVVKVAKVSRLVDVGATEEDYTSDHTLNKTRTLRDGEKTLSLIKKFNNHSLKIIRSSSGTNPAMPTTIEEATELEDLSAPKQAEIVPLDLRNKSSTIESTSKFPHESIPVEYIRALKAMKIDILSFLKGHMKSHSELKSMSSLLMPKEAPTLPTDVDSIPQDIQIFHSNAIEVLCHFWTCFPPGKDTERHAKLNRMSTIVEQLLIKGKSLISSRKMVGEQLAAENALLNVMTAMEHALDRKQSLTAHGEKRARIEP